MTDLKNSFCFGIGQASRNPNRWNWNLPMILLLVLLNRRCVCAINTNAIYNLQMALTFFETGFEFRAYKIGCLCLLELYTWRTNISEFVFISHKTFIYAIFLWEIRKLCSGNFCLFLSGLVFIFADGQSCNHASKYSKKCTFASFWISKNAKNKVFHFPRDTSLATFFA